MCSPLRDMGFLRISCLFMVFVEVNRRHSYAESCDCLGSATVAGTGRDSVFQVCVLLSLVLKLDDQTFLHLVYQPI